LPRNAFWFFPEGFCGYFVPCDFLLFSFFPSFLGGVRHIVPSGARVGCVVDMREGRRTMHFTVENELLPHAIAKMPGGDKMHVGVIFFSFFLCLYLIRLSIFINYM
jgi:hypothetical protein